jgi:hypothetical protein
MSMSTRPKNPIEGPTTALVPRPRLDDASWDDLQPPLREQLRYSRELTALWVQLRSDWSSLVILPAEADFSTSGFARSLCQVGTRFSIHPIEFLEAKELDLEASTRLIARLGASGKISGPADDGSFQSSSWSMPLTKTIVALESPLANPLAVPISLAADGIVLCVRRGRDRIASVRDTIAAVGSDRILCCVLLDDTTPGKTDG